MNEINESTEGNFVHAVVKWCLLNGGSDVCVPCSRM
jgi:hypothetical protein